MLLKFWKMVLATRIIATHFNIHHRKPFFCSRRYFYPIAFCLLIRNIDKSSTFVKSFEGNCKMSSMRYVDYEKPGALENLSIKSGPIPEPQASEILIQVVAAGVNRLDIHQRKGGYPPPAGASPILGVEVSGTVAAIGSEVTNWKVGDTVCALLAGGGYAEYCAVPAVQCLPVPKGVSLIEAAAIPETFFTVWTNVFTRGRLQPGETLLIHGGSSGIGTTGTQLARAWGANVFVTVGSEEKGEACLKLGANGYANYKTQDFVTKIRELNGGRGVNVILDMVGGDYFPKNLELLEIEGRLVQIAFQKGDNVNVPLRTIMMKRLTVTGSTLRARSPQEKGLIADDVFKYAWPLLEEKKVTVAIDRTYPLEQVAEAHQRMESSEHIGKIILIVKNV